MGIWAGGPDPRASVIDVAGIAAVMRPVLYAWMTGQIKVWDDHFQISPAVAYSPYETTADSSKPSTDPTLVFDSGVNGALIQPIRSPSRIEVAGQATGILGIRFQLRRLEVETGKVLRSGLRIEVVNGGESPDLVGVPFALMESIDSSLAWGRIWDAVLVTAGVDDG